MRKIELLAPAKNMETGIAAVNYGADAVYIGAEKFGARGAAGNSAADIAALADYAHRYHARVYAAVNTILFDDELEEAESLIRELYDSGIDAVIIQDMGIMEMDLPPVAIHASTQMNNFDIERIKFLDRVGVKRVVLARELSLPEIKKIRGAVKCELEFFVHGALCVSLSGQCYMSASIGGRSGNRGDCAQPCRNVYDLTDSSGQVIARGKHLLSIKDMSLYDSIKELIDGGADSLKIEGRLKDINYVKNIVALYRSKLDSILEGREDLGKASSGKVYFDFKPDPERTFNRGYTDYFIKGRTGPVGAFDSPKSAGKRMGTVEEAGNSFFTLSTDEKISNGDGLFFYDSKKNITGIRVNRVEGKKIFPLSMNGIFKGALLFRNHDAVFEKILDTSRTERKIKVETDFYETETGFGLTLKDEDGISVKAEIESAKEIARSGDGEAAIIKQLSKMGGTIFEASGINIKSGGNCFIQARVINELRRSAVEMLSAERIKRHAAPPGRISRNRAEYPFKEINYRWNVTNRLAKKFYKFHGVEKIESGFEILRGESSRQVMITKMCIKYELGACEKFQSPAKRWREPVYLTNGRDRFRLEFACKECMMRIFPA